MPTVFQELYYQTLPHKTQGSQGTSDSDGINALRRVVTRNFPRVLRLKFDQ